jgi:hypothetical protein
VADDSSYARSVQILVNLAGNPEERLDNINRQLDQMSGKKVSVGSDNSIQQLSGKAKEAGNSVNSISGAGKQVESSLTSSFSKIKSSIDDVHGGVQNLMSSLAGLAVGGSISGFSYLNAAQSKIATEQIYKAIDANKKWKISQEDVKKLADDAQNTGYIGSERQMLENIQAAGVRTGLTGEKLLTMADAAAKLSFSTQEAYHKSSSEIIRMASMDKLRQNDLADLAGMLTVAGVELKGGKDDSRLKDKKSRQKLIMQAAGTLNMEEEVSIRPWTQAENAVDDLSKAIGKSLVPVMVPLIKGFTDFIKLVSNIPGAPMIIGLAAAGLTLISTISLLNGVLGPGITLLKGMVAWTQESTIAEWFNVGSKQAKTIATVESATASALLSGAMGVEAEMLALDTAAAETATVANRGLAVSEGLVLSPLLIAAGVFIIIGGLLYLLESRTGVFSKALKQLSETEMGQDLIQWFKDVGYWIDEGAKGLGSFLGDSITQVNELYKGLKSGTGTNISNTLTIGLGVILGPIGLLVPILRNSMPIIQSETKIISDAITYIKNLLDDGWKTITGIYTGITNLPQKLSDAIKGVSGNAINSAKDLAGFNTMPAGFWEYFEGKIGDKFNQAPTNIRNLAYKNAMGTELTPEELATAKTYRKWDDLLSSMKNNAKSFTPNLPTEDTSKQKSLTDAVADGIKEGLDIDTNIRVQNTAANLANEDLQGPAGSKADWNVATPFVALGRAAVGAASGAYDSLAGVTKHAKGGFAKSAGLTWVDPNEPIIAADVANNSRLQSVLESIAYGNTVTNQGDIKVNINYTAPSGSSGNMIVMDKWSFEKMVADVVAQKLRQLNGY